MTILRLITNIVFDSGINFTLPFAILYVAGLWGMFKKSGVKSWHSLIPALREYQLAARQRAGFSVCSAWSRPC